LDTVLQEQLGCLGAFQWGFSPLLPKIVRPSKTKKADVAEHPKVFDHVGLLSNKPTGRAGVFFG
jgi:hypothetical protein